MSVHRDVSPGEKAGTTILWVISAIPLALVGVFFFVTAHGIEMWCGGGLCFAFVFGITQKWWAKINNRF